MATEIASPKRRVTDEHATLRVLLRNKRACCVCHAYERPVQIHHIDGDRARSVESNLAVLCLTHHDQATAGLRRGQVGLGAKLSPDEVRAHKAAWEDCVRNELKGTRKVVSSFRRKQLELLFEFELIKAKNEILTARRQEQVETRLTFLTEFLIEEFVSGIPYRKFLLDAFSDLATRSAGAERTSIPLLAALPNLHLHLVGPHEVKMFPEDKRALLGAMAVIETLGSFGVFLAKNERIVRDACKVIRELAEIGGWYRLRELVSKALRVLRAMEKEWERLPATEKRKPANRKKLRLIQRTITAIAGT